jgi:hypothetical protein
MRTNSVPPVPPATGTAVRNYSDKFKKQMVPGAAAAAAAAAVPVSISSFTEFPSLRKAATAIHQAVESTAATAATAATPATSWAKTAKVAHEKDLARLEKERLAEVERLAEEEKERIRNTIHRVGIHSIRDSTMPTSRREDEWTAEDDEEDEEGMGYVANNYAETGYDGDKYTETGYVSNKYTDSGTPPYSPFDREEINQGIVEND